MRKVCGLDVHKDSFFACIMNEKGEKIQKKFGVLTSELDSLRDLLVCNDVGEVAMESTSVYWMPIWRILESDFDLKLVNAYFIKQLLEEVELDEKHKNECQMKMNELCKEHFPEQLENLQIIPGIKERSATAIIAELGVDMKMFLTAAALVSWCGLKPRNEESAGKIKSRKITHENKYLRKTMIECTWGASRTQGSFFNKFSYVQTTVRRKNQMKVRVAIARKMLVTIWNILSKGEVYREIMDQNASACG